MLLSIDGLTAPRPVHAMINGSREVIEMGADVKLPILTVAGAATAPVLLLYAKAWPIPFAVVVKIPGDAGTMGTGCGADVPLVRVTTTFTEPLSWPVGRTLNGICALIC
jgi:hypothetical protein